MLHCLAPHPKGSLVLLRGNSELIFHEFQNLIDATKFNVMKKKNDKSKKTMTY